MLPVCVGVDSVISNPCNVINPEGSEEEKVFFFFCFEYLITFFLPYYSYKFVQSEKNYLGDPFWVS